MFDMGKQLRKMKFAEHNRRFELKSNWNLYGEIKTISENKTAFQAGLMQKMLRRKSTMAVKSVRSSVTPAYNATSSLGLGTDSFGTEPMTATHKTPKTPMQVLQESD